MNYITAWFQRYFSDPQAMLLVVLLGVGFGVVLTMGDMLGPVLTAVVVAYLLEGIIRLMERRGAPRFRVVLLVYTGFLAFLAFLLFGLTPLLWAQTVELARELPNYIQRGQDALMRLPQHYSFISQEQITEVMQALRGELLQMGQHILSISLSSIPGVITLVVYLVLVPLLVFFFLKDKVLLIGWVTSLLPKERSLATAVWVEVDQQIGNYIRGKFWEVLTVGVSTFVVFAFMGMKYSMLLAALVGLSVIVPYIGAAVVTFPVAAIAYFQWGWSSEFAWLMVAYGVVQALDGNVLVPLLFSEVVNLHPVAIIVAVLVFGGLWGLWGVFFAIPLATLVNALISAWPRSAPHVIAVAPPSPDEEAARSTAEHEV